MSEQRHNPRECWCGIDHSRTPRCEKCGGPRPGEFITCSLAECPYATNPRDAASVGLSEVNVNGVRYFAADDYEAQQRRCAGLADALDETEQQLCAAEDALAEAERVLRVISGWNTDRVDTATAIAPAASYFATKDLNAKLEAESNG